MMYSLSQIFICLCLSLTMPASLICQDVYIVPHSRKTAPQEYQYSLDMPSAALSEWRLFNKLLLEKKGLQLTPVKHLNIQQAPAIFFLNTPNWISRWKQLLPKLRVKKRILIALEPPSVKPKMYKKQILRLFDRVLTWDDSLVDNRTFFKFNYAALKPMLQEIPSFHDKKLLTQISGNRHSSHPNELYTARKKVIEYFEKQRGNDFEFYGTDWPKSTYRNYRGIITDKLTTLKKYRFSICFENICNIKGYITEKIFDCFAAGVVPIYLGASNITDYIPADCFIDYRQFSSIDDLIRYIKALDETSYNRYIDNIRRFLDSSTAQKFSKQAFAESLLQSLEK